MDINLDYERTTDLTKKLNDSTDWVILRIDSTGIHCHMKNENSLSMLPLFLYNHDALYKFTVATVNKIKKQNK
jgi:hypothetical protein